MIKSMVTGHLMRRGVRFLPGGWITMLALSPTGRRVMRSSWNYVQKRQQGRSGHPPTTPR